MKKWGVLNQFGNIYVEEYNDNTFARYDYVVEYDIISNTKGNGEGRFKFFTNKVLEKIYKNNWAILPIVEAHYNWGGVYRIYIDLIDPKGLSKKKMFEDNNGNRGGNEMFIRYIFNILEECSVYSNWEQYDIVIENIELKKENKKLQNIVINLQNL